MSILKNLTTNEINIRICFSTGGTSVDEIELLVIFVMVKSLYCRSKGKGRMSGKG
ncbi:hypothetical protein ND2E_2617 [Colwellia psychrerythraea]|uniref:Uncharacterized protein n=1 Tax=Colwellia psychrerythraea TaxID=28229 RepID=A0A099KRN7_COLPS|nr:hypothetical protein ND2E_2617 [Colwellia psychrerythraea]